MTTGRIPSLGEQVVAHAQRRPDGVAVACDGQVLTFAKLVLSASRCAAGLQGAGLPPGGPRRVGILAANSTDFVVVVVACQLAGIAIVPLPSLVTTDAQARMIADADVDVLFCDDGNSAAAVTAMTLAVGVKLRSLVVFGSGVVPARAHRFDEWLEAADAPFSPGVIDPDWVSDLIYSSGTTGTPKGITQTFGSRRAQCISFEALGFSSETSMLHTIGLYSNFGLSALLITLWWGSAFHMQRKFSAEATVALLASKPIDMAWFAPATLTRTIEAPGFADAVGGKACVKLCAGAPLSEAQKHQVAAAWPGPFYDVYGQTETGTLTMLAMHAAPSSKWQSVGTVLPSAAVRIIDDDGNVMPVGTEGEIAGHSSTLMSGYHARDDANASAFWRDVDGRLFIRTGDVGKFDEDGYLWLCDRKKDMIISGGFNIYPADIERVLAEHPAVFEAAVVGCASHRWGETPVAFLTLREGATAEAEEVRSWLNSRVGAVQRVAAVQILAELPNGTMGKILKRTLRDTHAAELGILP